MAVGRPPLYNNAEDLEKKIQEFWESCETKNEELPDGSTSTIDGRHPTITGLAHFLGFESRQSFYDYAANDVFSYTIKRARLQIEANYEQALFSKNPTGPIFALKNFGWKDTQEIKHDLPRAFLNLDPLADDTAHDGIAENSQA